MDNHSYATFCLLQIAFPVADGGEQKLLDGKLLDLSPRSPVPIPMCHQFPSCYFSRRSTAHAIEHHCMREWGNGMRTLFSWVLLHKGIVRPSLRHPRETQRFPNLTLIW